MALFARNDSGDYMEVFPLKEVSARLNRPYSSVNTVANKHNVGLVCYGMRWLNVLEIEQLSSYLRGSRGRPKKDLTQEATVSPKEEMHTECTEELIDEIVEPVVVRKPRTYFVQVDKRTGEEREIEEEWIGGINTNLFRVEKRTR